MASLHLRKQRGLGDLLEARESYLQDGRAPAKTRCFVQSGEYHIALEMRRVRLGQAFALSYLQAIPLLTRGFPTPPAAGAGECFCRMEVG